MRAARQSLFNPGANLCYSSRDACAVCAVSIDPPAVAFCAFRCLKYVLAATGEQEEQPTEKPASMSKKKAAKKQRTK